MPGAIAENMTHIVIRFHHKSGTPLDSTLSAVFLCNPLEILVCFTQIDIVDHLGLATARTEPFRDDGTLQAYRKNDHILMLFILILQISQHL